MKSKYDNLKWLLLTGVFHASSALAHSLPSIESMMIMTRASVNYMPKVLAQNCDVENVEIQTRIKNVSNLLSKKLSLDEICDQDCISDEGKKGLNKEEVAQLLIQFDRRTAEKDEKNCSKYLNFLESVQQNYNQPLADLVKEKNPNAPDVIYDLRAVATSVWSYGKHDVIGQFNNSVINLSINYRSFYHKAIETGVFDPPNKYSFLISIHRNHTDKNPLPVKITIEEVFLKINGKAYQAQLTRSTQSGCCNSTEIQASFDYVGQIGKEPFELEISGINDAGIQYPSLIYQSVAEPAGLVKASRVLQEFIMLQLKRD
ncbi:hypothetical protein [Crenothrix sp.]|uniref:hypothetical protein n=1 Tax=Crenothrix sp. TaxID=3100433 RepID=UPI00374CBDCE